MTDSGRLYSYLCTGLYHQLLCWTAREKGDIARCVAIFLSRMDMALFMFLSGTGHLLY